MGTPKLYGLLLCPLSAWEAFDFFHRFILYMVVVHGMLGNDIEVPSLVVSILFFLSSDITKLSVRYPTLVVVMLGCGITMTWRT